MAGEPLLSVRDLSVTLHVRQGDVAAAEQVSFDVHPGETVGLVGESGSGKSVVLRAVMGLLPPNATVTGSIRWRGEEMLGASEAAWSRLRGREVGMVFQDPMTALNPIRRIGSQLVEGPRLHLGWSAAEARRQAVELLSHVGIADPEQVARKYPHQLSGGMRQRVLIAMARACHPSLLLCDEPTTALDVTVQKQILGLLDHSARELGAAVVLVSHDLAVVAQLCRDVQVMYAGQVVEAGPIAEVFADPRHAYTAALLASLPRMDGERRRPASIPGELPDRFHRPAGCRFHRRCTVAGETCSDEPYALRPVGPHGPTGHGLPERGGGALPRVSACFYSGGVPTRPISPVPAIPGAPTLPTEPAPEQVTR